MYVPPVVDESPVNCVPFINNVVADTVVALTLLDAIVLADKKPLIVNPLKLFTNVLITGPLLLLVIVSILLVKVTPVGYVSLVAMFDIGDNTKPLDVPDKNNPDKLLTPE